MILSYPKSGSKSQQALLVLVFFHFHKFIQGFKCCWIMRFAYDPFLTEEWIKKPTSFACFGLFSFSQIQASLICSIKKAKHMSAWLFDHLVIAEGFEPSTVCLEGRCSIQLSYATIFGVLPNKK